MDAQLLRFQENKTYVVFDGETENLNLKLDNNLIWQFSALIAKGSKVIETKSWYIKWDRPLNVSRKAAEVTHFNPYIVDKEGVYYKDVFEVLYPILQNANYCIGHNSLGFDCYLLKDWYKKMGKYEDFKLLVPKMLDTNFLAKGVKLNYIYKPGENLLEYQYRVMSQKAKGVKTNLTALGKEFNITEGIDYNQLHNSGMDVLLTFKIWNHLKWQIEI